MMEYICIGFDLKVWPCDGSFNIDETGWSNSEKEIEHIKSKFNVGENEYQLLDLSANTIKEILEYIESIESCNIISVRAPLPLVLLNDKKYGYKTSKKKYWDEVFHFLGFDVCDLNGLFSMLHHEYFEGLRGTASAFKKNEYQLALEACVIAGTLDTQHAPLSVVELRKFK